jgi:hypothetical protein
MADGRWQMADGRWQMADGRWQMADGRWQMAELGSLTDGGYRVKRVIGGGGYGVFCGWRNIRFLSALQDLGQSMCALERWEFGVLMGGDGLV